MPIYLGARGYRAVCCGTVDSGTSVDLGLGAVIDLGAAIGICAAFAMCAVIGRCAVRGKGDWFRSGAAIAWDAVVAMTVYLLSGGARGILDLLAMVIDCKSMLCFRSLNPLV